MGSRVAPALELKMLTQAGVNPVLGLSEAKFQSKVTALATAEGWEWFHVYDSRLCPAGFPDLVVIRTGVLVVAELKVGRNKTTADQEKWLALFESIAGTRVFRWRPEHWFAIYAELTGKRN
ncbi:hypothetical protein [Gemmata sp. SH-PL17]|uniref:hypothetical protein n=1 Tax=Gemmata sp. SH-PL17 TaxID=1630693 RepID=UPI0009EDB543|nr:hypothetical protein [Gemmata sp. SH-PL17]